MMTTLAPADLQRLRLNVQRFGNRLRQVPTVAAEYVGGPLDGLRVRVDEYAARCQFGGWCVVTPTGPVTALYEHDDGSGRWRFSQLDAGPR